jgi:uncharacterized membrane protein
VGTESRTGPGGSSARLQFIDLLRGWAVIVMIQTHVLNATLRDQLRGETAYQLLSFVDGLVAPSFIFASGFVFAVALRRKLPDYLSFGPALGRQAGKLLFVLAVGYALHLPVFSLRGLLSGASAERWEAFWAVDVLQCIAVSLLLVMLVLLVVRTERRLFAVLPWVAAGVALATPIAWSVNPAWLLPLPVATYLNAGHGSQFPLFPWSSFLVSGVVAGGAFVAARGRTSGPGGDDPVRTQIRRFAVIGAGMVAVSFAIEPVFSALYPPHNYWQTSPAFVVLRLGLVLLLLAICYAYEQRKGVGERSIVALMGRESLLVYAAHLMLIYGDFSGFSFVRWVNRSFGYAEVFATTALLIVLMVLLAAGWDRVRRGDRKRMRYLQALALASFLVVFLLAPG